MYKKRIVQERLRLFAQNFKIILVVGARQVGKSTLLRNIFPEMECITFDPSSDIRGARSQPDDFLNNHPSPLILDEVQYAPELFPALKRRVDLSTEKGQYFLTGSHNLSMLRNAAETMSGRVGILNLSAMSIHELYDNVSFDEHGKQVPPSWLSTYLASPESLIDSFAGTLKSRNSLEAMWYGGMPTLIDMHPSLVHEYFDGYVKTYLERDVQLHYAPRDLREFRNFLGVMAALTAQELNYKKLSSSVEATHGTLKRWLNLLDASYLWYEIKPYSRDNIKRVSKRGKGYLADTGLVCALQRLSTPNAIASHNMKGALFETYCVNQVRALMGNLPTKPALYHWRSAGGAEVDLVLSLDGKLYPIEIKCKSNITGHDARGIRAFQETYGSVVQDGVILHTGHECYRVSSRVTALPWHAVMKQT